MQRFESCLTTPYANAVRPGAARHITEDLALVLRRNPPFAGLNVDDERTWQPLLERMMISDFNLERLRQLLDGSASRAAKQTLATLLYIWSPRDTLPPRANQALKAHQRLEKNFRNVSRWLGIDGPAYRHSVTAQLFRGASVDDLLGPPPPSASASASVLEPHSGQTQRTAALGLLRPREEEGMVRSPPGSRPDVFDYSDTTTAHRGCPKLVVGRHTAQGFHTVASATAAPHALPLPRQPSPVAWPQELLGFGDDPFGIGQRRADVTNAAPLGDDQLANLEELETWLATWPDASPDASLSEAPAPLQVAPQAPSPAPLGAESQAIGLSAALPTSMLTLRQDPAPPQVVISSPWAHTQEARATDPLPPMFSDDALHWGCGDPVCAGGFYGSCKATRIPSRQSPH